MIDFSNTVFLLGGYDLEMVEIKNMLEKHGLSYCDKKLRWDNADLSQYKEELEAGKIYYGIELNEDYIPDVTYYSINHHDDSIGNKSAIEQVATLIGIPLSREQELIAANDSGYIQAMQKKGATEEEIKSIRQRDRRAQGATERDDQLAAVSIKDNLSFRHDVMVVKSATSFYSSVTDLLFPYEKLIIYDDETLVYYGHHINRLVNEFSSLITKGGIYYGGSLSFGFWGLKKRVFTKAQIENIKDKIINTVMDIHSKHIFLFPFTIQNKPYNKVEFLTDLEKFGWKSPDNLDTNEVKIYEYNERQYFHKFAYNAIFSGGGSVEKYLYDGIHENESWTYSIEIEKKIKKIKKERFGFEEEEKPDLITKYTNQTYDLSIEKITLIVYQQQGICVFGFHLNNYKYNNPEDILLINQYGRRLYPPFLDLHVPFTGGADHLKGTQLRVFPVSIKIKKNQNEVIVNEDYSLFKTIPVAKIQYLPGHIAYFFTIKEEPFENENFSIKNEDGGTCIKIMNKYDISYLLNDRMFVIGWYGAEQLTYDYRKLKKTRYEELKEKKYVLSDLCRKNNESGTISYSRDSYDRKVLLVDKKQSDYGYVSNDFWYQYLFVDADSPSCTDSTMRTNLVKDHTYSRWVEYGTLYGISRYSFVSITEPQKNLAARYPNSLFLLDHIDTMYHDMVSLILAQRVMILKFSLRATELNVLDEPKMLAIEELNREYKDFINKILYTEICSEDQGIELYDMLKEHTRVNEQAKSLEKQIHDLYWLQEMVASNRRNKKLDTIQIMTTSFAVFSLLFSLRDRLYDKSFTPKQSTQIFEQWPLNADFWYTIVGLGIISVLLLPSLLKWNSPSWKTRRWIKLTMSIVAALFYLVLFGFELSPWFIIFMGILFVCLLIEAVHQYKGVK
ncbi:MAG: hypothetical protein WAN85_07090 [Bacteroidales bacterium]